MARADIKAGRAYVELYVQKSAFLRGMNEARKQLGQFGDDILSIGRKMAVAGGILAGALGAATARFISFGDQLDKASARTGIAASRLAALGFAAEQSGTNLESVESAIKRMQRVVTDAARGSRSAADALAMISLSSKQLEGLKPDEQFRGIAAEIAKVEDPTRRAAIAMQIFGKSGTMLLPMLADLEALAKEAESLGIVPLEKDVKAAAALGDAFNRMKRTFFAALFEIGAAIAPIARDVINFVTVFVRGIQQMIRENRELIVSLVRVAIEITAVTAAIVAVGVAAKVAAVSLGLLLSILAGPRGMAWAAAGIVAASVAMQAFGDDTARTYGIITQLAQGGQVIEAWEITVQQMRVIWLEFTSAIPNAWNDMLRNLAKSIASIHGFFGYDAEGEMKVIDQQFNETQRKILKDLEAAQAKLRQLQAAAVNSLQAGGGSTQSQAGGMSAGAGTLQAGGQRQIGTFSAAAFRAEQGGTAYEIKQQIDAIKRATDAIERGNVQNHADMVDLAKAVRLSGVSFG